MTKQQMPAKGGQYILADFVLLILWILVLLPVYVFLHFLPQDLSAPAKALLSFPVLYLGLTLVAWLLPKPKAGVHSLKSLSGRLWFLNLQFSRVWMFPPLKHLIFSSSVLRTLFLQAMGCKIPLRHSFSTHAELHDPYMISIGAGSVIGLHVLMGGHMIFNGQLHLKPVEIGENCILGAETKIMPGCKIGDGTIIEVGTDLLINSQIPKGCHIGHHSIISAKTQLSEGAKIPAYFTEVPNE